MSFSLRRFSRHYVEMVIAMFAGMFVLGLPAEAGLRALGTSSSALQTDAPDLSLLGMATIMTVPMVAWMRVRGHGWLPCAEMAASMYLPTVAIMALRWTGAVDEYMTLMTLQHVAMFPAMLAAMALRPLEYGACHHAPAARLA